MGSSYISCVAVCLVQCCEHLPFHDFVWLLLFACIILLYNHIYIYGSLKAMCKSLGTDHRENTASNNPSIIARVLLPFPRGCYSASRLSRWLLPNNGCCLFVSRLLPSSGSILYNINGGLCIPAIYWLMFKLKTPLNQFTLCINTEWTVNQQRFLVLAGMFRCKPASRSVERYQGAELCTEHGGFHFEQFL
jgi:hypothetical protein